ncbi:MAG: hypothetical protein IT428_21955 [Planctomycetaceae bacterium]|nr:hypothetical protein [Planctomycetaceae bacterium]
MTAGFRGVAAIAAGTFFLAAPPCYSEPMAVQPATIQKAGCCGGGAYGDVGPGGYSGPVYDHGHGIAGPVGGAIGGPMPDPFYDEAHAPAPIHGPTAPGFGGLGYGGHAFGGPVGGPAVGPPPGTVGTTYRRPSRPVGSDKHPRAGIVDVSVEGAYDMGAEGMKSFRAKDGIWRLETKEPLIPGLPHIYHIRAVLGDGDDAPVEYRTVRLIPGRIVELQW